jgi:hypothetical protein
LTATQSAPGGGKTRWLEELVQRTAEFAEQYCHDPELKAELKEAVSIYVTYNNLTEIDHSSETEPKEALALRVLFA